jgi:ubiquinone/menaquinone biosynthesis C-methylase UbiE
MSLFNMDDIPAAVAEAARVLRTGGHFCASVLHPVFTAGVEEGDRFVISRSYFEEGTNVWSSDRAGIQMTFHDRRVPLQDYASALERAGLLIESVREVGSDRDLVPLFLHVRALKVKANTRS